MFYYVAQVPIIEILRNRMPLKKLFQLFFHCDVMFSTLLFSEMVVYEHESHILESKQI